MGLKLGAFGFFRVIKITVVLQVHMSLHLLQSKREDKTHLKCCMVLEDCGCTGFVFVLTCVVSSNLKTPKLSPIIVDDALRRAVY